MADMSDYAEFTVSDLPFFFLIIMQALRFKPIISYRVHTSLRSKSNFFSKIFEKKILLVLFICASPFVEK